MRGAAFPHPDDPLDRASIARIGAISLTAGARALCSPALAARETAASLGLAAIVEPALADIDNGEWAGRRFDQIERAALAAWSAAPHLGAPGGETLGQVVERVAALLDRIQTDGGAVIAITHATTIRAALAMVLGVDPTALLVVDVAPLSSTRLSFSDRWRLQELRRA